MARCNHILALQLWHGTNVASVSAWANGAYHVLRYHSRPKQNRNCVGVGVGGTSSQLPFHLQSIGSYDHHDLLKKNVYVMRGGQQCRHFSLASHGRTGDDCNDLVPSVRDSLRYVLVQPHLDECSLRNEDSNSYKLPTIVLILAVSGGCDSIALFHSVLSLTESNDDEPASTSDSNNPQLWLNLGVYDRKQHENDTFRIPCELHVAHFNHEQRGENSDKDEALVKKLCEEHGLTCHSFLWSEEDFSAGAGPDSSSLESDSSIDDEVCLDETPDMTNNSGEISFTQDIARKWRRRRLKELLSKLVLSVTDATSISDEIVSQSRWGAILTAHHRDDADETILLKLLRGSHLTNLSGMDARSDGFDLNTVDGHQSLQQPPSLGYFAKPMLNVRKKDAVEHLTSNALEWREDESNSSNKYKRNKVRNELMPLLSEIAGGEQALQKRFNNLEQQSRDISIDLTKRSRDYLQVMSSNSAVFVLPRDSSFDLVAEEALHLWTMEVTNRKLQLPYDQMLRIRNQICDSPNRLQWTLDVGNNWKLRRNGDTLAVFNDSENVSQGPNGTPGSSLPWAIIPNDDQSTADSPIVHTLCFGSLPEHCDPGDIQVKQVKDTGNIKFKPPWRKGRKAIKIKEFLRGQRVPLHLRDETIILCLSDDSSKQVLAVYLGGTDITDGKWIINADFCPQDGLPETKLFLERPHLIN